MRLPRVTKQQKKWLPIFGRFFGHFPTLTLMYNSEHTYLVPGSYSKVLLLHVHAYCSLLHQQSAARSRTLAGTKGAKALYLVRCYNELCEAILYSQPLYFYVRLSRTLLFCQPMVDRLIQAQEEYAQTQEMGHRAQVSPLG